MKPTRWRVLAAGLLAFALLAAACGDDDSESAAADELKIAIVYIGPTADKGWSWAHDQGMNFVEANMDNVTITRIENVAEGPESQRVFEDLAADGNKLIFGTSFGYMDFMLAAGENYPDTVFMHATGFKSSDNVANYFGAAEEARYLSGMAAGADTETNLIGYVAAFPIAEVLRGINAFTLGVRELNPDAKVQVVWTSTWFDPLLEGDAAQALLDAGADVIAMHQDTTAAGEKAESAGASWVGYNADRNDFAPTAWLTAPIWNWGGYYLSVAEAVRNGTWNNAAYYGTMADGTVELASFGDSVPQDVRDLIDTRKTEIISGDFAVFPDPIVNQDGASQPLGNIFEMDYFVEGVIGSASG